MTGYCDAHNHLQDERFNGRQDALVADCLAVGVRHMVVNGSSPNDWPAVSRLATRYPGRVLPAFGCHPWHLACLPPDWPDLLASRIAQHPDASIGEVGLDRWILEPHARRRCPDARPLPLADQIPILRHQLALARQRDRPASIHCIHAWGALMDVLESAPLPARGFLLHSYGGPVDWIPRLAGLGAYFSFPGYFAHPRKQRQRDAFRSVPPDRLLVETDAPDQSLPNALVEWTVSSPASIPLPGATHASPPLNHPANLPAVYRQLAVALDTDLEQLARQVAENFTRLFLH